MNVHILYIYADARHAIYIVYVEAAALTAPKIPFEKV